MDNKKWYKKFMTIFWCSLTALPFILILIYFIGYHLTFNSGINTANELATYHSINYGTFDYVVNSVGSDFGSYVPLFMVNTFDGFFSNVFNINNHLNMANLFAWCLWVQVIHLLFDMLAFFIHLIHDFMDMEKYKLY